MPLYDPSLEEARARAMGATDEQVRRVGNAAGLANVVERHNANKRREAEAEQSRRFHADHVHLERLQHENQLLEHQKSNERYERDLKNIRLESKSERAIAAFEEIAYDHCADLPAIRRAVRSYCDEHILPAIVGFPGMVDLFATPEYLIRNLGRAIKKAEDSRRRSLIEALNAFEEVGRERAAIIQAAEEKAAAEARAEREEAAAERALTHERAKLFLLEHKNVTSNELSCWCGYSGQFIVVERSVNGGSTVASVFSLLSAVLVFWRPKVLHCPRCKGIKAQGPFA